MRLAAQRLFQAVLGSAEQRSSAEQQDIEKAANREPWVHEVRRIWKPACLPASNWKIWQTDVWRLHEHACAILQLCACMHTLAVQVITCSSLHVSEGCVSTQPCEHIMHLCVVAYLFIV